MRELFDDQVIACPADCENGPCSLLTDNQREALKKAFEQLGPALNTNPTSSFRRIERLVNENLSWLAEDADNVFSAPKVANTGHSVVFGGCPKDPASFRGEQ